MTAPTAPAVESAPAPESGRVDALALAVEARKAALNNPEPVKPLATPGVTTLPTPEPEVDPNAPEVEPETVDPNAPPVEPEVELITLPGRRPGDEDLAVEITDPAVANRFREVLNAYERKTDSTARFAEANAMIEEAHTFQTLVKIDPAGMVQETLDPNTQAYLALNLLTQPEMWDRLAPTVAALLGISLDMLTDEHQKMARQNLREVQLEMRDQRTKLKEEAERAATEWKQATRNARDIEKALTVMVPQTLKGDQRSLWVQDQKQALREYVNRTGAAVIYPGDIPTILSGRLRAHGVDPVQASMAIQQLFTRQPKAPAAVAAAPAQANGEKIVQAAQARRAASAAAPTGIGSPPAALPKMPKGLGLKDALNFQRERLGIAPK